MRDDDAERYSLQSVLRAIMREGFESTNGRLRYSISVYENVTRATVPFAHEGEDRFYLLLSFDEHAYTGAIIANRMLPAIFEKGIASK